MKGLLEKVLDGVLARAGERAKKEQETKLAELKKNLGIAVLDISGPLVATSEDGGRYRYVLETLESLKQISPKALVLRINSPGGTTGASEEIYRAVVSLKQATGVKVVAMMEDVCASGGLYVAMSADRIVAKGGTITGSIGVILQGYDYQQILDFLRLKTRTIKSGKYKDILSPSREMRDDEVQLLQEMILDVHEQFASVVAESRGLKMSEVGTFADGRIMTGRQAMAYQLVDVLGGYDVALREAARLANVPQGMKVEVWSGPKKDVFSKLGLSSHVSVLDSIALNAKMSGLPLWLMPTFKP